MTVWATKKKPISSPLVDCLLAPVQLPTILQEADYVVIAVPLTRETINLIGPQELAFMKSTAYLINIARGAVVHQEALYTALKQKTIRGACLDVFQDEKPLSRNSRFYNLPNLLITSYSAHYYAESEADLMDLFFANLERFVSGETLLNIIDSHDPL